MVNSNLLLGLCDLTLNVPSTGPGLRLVYKATSVAPFPIHKTKIELFSFYCALWLTAKKESIKTFSFTVFLLHCLKSELYRGLREFEQHENTKSWRREKPLVLSRASWKTGVLMHRKFCHFKMWFQSESEQNPKSFQIPLEMEILRILVWKCWSRVFLIPTSRPRPAEQNRLSRQLAAVQATSSPWRWEVSWGTPTVTSPREPLQKLQHSEHSCGSPHPCWASWGLHSWVLAVHRVVGRAVLRRRRMVEVGGREEGPVSFLEKSPKPFTRQHFALQPWTAPSSHMDLPQLGWHLDRKGHIWCGCVCHSFQNEI